MSQSIFLSIHLYAFISTFYAFMPLNCESLNSNFLNLTKSVFRDLHVYHQIRRHGVRFMEICVSCFAGEDKNRIHNAILTDSRQNLSLRSISCLGHCLMLRVPKKREHSLKWL